jgi:hypothetical protein
MAPVIFPNNYPNEFGVVTQYLRTTYANQPRLLLYADRDMALDQIVLGVHVVHDNGGQVWLVKTTNGTSASPSQSISNATLAGLTPITTANTDVTTTGYKVMTLLSGDTNVLKAGNWLALICNNATSGSSAPLEATIQVRFHTQLG